MTGNAAVKESIHAAKSVARILKSSLGPKGMDKMLQSSDGDVTISEWGGLWEQGAAPRSPASDSRWGGTLCGLARVHVWRMVVRCCWWWGVG